MHFSLPTILSLTYHLSLSSPLQLSLPPPQSIPPSLLRSRHSIYIDQKLQLYHNAATPNIPIPLNHNLYHQRNVTPIPPTTSNISLNHELYSKRNAILSLPAIPNSDTTTGDNTTNVDIEKSCISALTSLHGTASNPSGIAACYNVLAFDNTTGGFEAEVRLYRVGKPKGEWSGVDTVGEGVDVGVVFEKATVLSIGNAGDDGSEGDTGVVGGRNDVGVGEGEVFVGAEEAKDLWRRRNAPVVRYVGGVEVEGRVDAGGSMVVGDV